MFRRIGRVFKESFKGITKHKAMSFSSVSAVTLTLIIIGAFLVISTSLQRVVDGVENSVQIHAKISNDLSNSEIKTLQERIKQLDNVDNVTFSSKDEELQFFIKSYGDKADLFSMYVGKQNPMLNAFLINVKDPLGINDVSELVSKMKGIVSVNYGGNGTIELVESMENIKNSSYLVVLVLAVLAILLISNTINATITSRTDEIVIMKYVGATNWFIRWPFIIEGIIIGLLGSIIPIAALGGIYYYLYNLLGGYIFTEIFTMYQPAVILPQLAVVLMICGVAVGMIGSCISVTFKLWGKR